MEKWEGRLISGEQTVRDATRAVRTPLGPLHAEAVVQRTANHKTYARGFISDTQGPTVEAEGVFIEPAWARNGGGTGR